MTWIKYLLFAIFLVFTLICAYFAYRFFKSQSTEREINLYSSWLMRLWMRFRTWFMVLLSVLFGLMSVGALVVEPN